MKDEWTRRAQCKSIGIKLLVLLPPVPPAQKELRSMQMCAVDKDLKREHAVDAVLLSTCTQHRLRLDIQLDLEGGGGDGFVHRLVLKWFYIIVVVVKAEREVAGSVAVALGAEVVEGQRGRCNNRSISGSRQMFQFWRLHHDLARCWEFFKLTNEWLIYHYQGGAMV